jgi:4-alpha-glucanotransferase
MSSNGGLRNFPPVAPEYRAAGLLLHVTSLPSPYGIGNLGPSAFSWVDRLHDAGQRWWQARPLGPTGYGNSPYQSLSSFAGNVLLLISPDALIAGQCYAGERSRDPMPVEREDALSKKCSPENNTF